jgi:hypothetical protein
LKRAIAAGLAGVVVLGLGTASLAAAPPTAEIRTLAAGAAPPSAKADQLKALEGSWTSPDALLGFSAPRLNEIVGHLYITQNNTSGLHELWTIKAKGDSLAVMQNFFNGDLSPRGDGKWTERPLVAIGPGDVFYFNGMTLTAGKDALQIAVRVGGPNPIVFNFTRAK